MLKVNLVLAGLCCLFSAVGICSEDEFGLKGEGDAVIELSSWDEVFAVWKHAVFIKENLIIPLYATGSNVSVGLGVSSDSVSLDKKYVAIQRTVFGELDDGRVVEPTEKSYCDIVSLENGCVLLSRPAQICSGSWVESGWVADSGESIAPELEIMAPKELVASIANIRDPKSRVVAIKDQLFMGVESYMSCYPSAKNPQALNDIGFYLAQGGDDASALKLYRGVETVGRRTVLMLNIADSLWHTNQKAEAVRYYQEYVNAMTSEGKAERIPLRVRGRVE